MSGIQVGFDMACKEGIAAFQKASVTLLISCTRRLEVAATRDKTCLRRLKSLGFVLVRAGGLRLYSRDF
ncbi:hypothetical protein [Nostoc sp. UHCC 0252]|uniref:hypothetical protein n=1 Tax=Nostoc sp. UHCC 0252 TaxID=3110241 RepID=UPI002B1F24A7|nr:hypothetical protein [Nostoc sp. UHCC 0252]MEA5602243.1 hypothetical protein [Nostoc sp. UHCC 0252]